MLALDEGTSMEERMRRVMQRAERGRRGLPAPQVWVRAGDREFTWGDRKQRFHTASVGKMMTATRVLQLVEQGRLALDAPLTSLLPAVEIAGLFVLDGVDRAAEVTPLQLLRHMSGVADYFAGRSSAPVRFPGLIAAEPDRVWTSSDLLDYSRQFQRAVGAPGERFSYSDTGYVLLGRILEEAGSASLGIQLHEGVFAPAGMDASCLLFHTMPGGGPSVAEPAAQLDIAPLWVGKNEVSRAAALSCDWAGGGVVSTVDDLVAFTRAWTSGALIGDASRAVMGDAPQRFRPGIRYGAGAMRLRYGGFSPFLAGMPSPVGHIGVTSTHLFVFPERDLHIAMNFHSTREMLRSFRTHIELVRIALKSSR